MSQEEIPKISASVQGYHADFARENFTIILRN